MPAKAPAKIQPLSFDKPPHRGTPQHPGGQRLWLEQALSHQFIVIAVGRQVGKTTFKRYLDIQEGMHHRGQYRSAYMAQTHTRAELTFRADLKNYEAANMVLDAQNKGQLRYLDLRPFGLNDGARFYYWSGDPESHAAAAGESLHRFQLDEASLVPRAALTSTLRPMLNATRGKGAIYGSPYPEGIGFDWFEEEWNKGDPEHPTYDPDYVSFNAPSESNPFTDPKWILQQRKSCASPEEERCQYDGLFARDIGAVFSNLAAVFCLPVTSDEGRMKVYRESGPDEPCVMGLDFGAHADSTVASVFSMRTNEQLAVAKFHRIPYDDQLVALDGIFRRFHEPIVMADGRDAGGHLCDVLRKKYENRVQTVKWTNGGVWDKSSSVTHGMRLCQSGSWKLIDLLDQREEFRLYSKKRRPSDTGWLYSAPSTKHDDYVAAALYAAYKLPIVQEPTRVREDERVYKHNLEEGSAAWWDFLRETQAGSRVSYYTTR